MPTTMFYLLIALQPFNAIHSVNLWLYSATMFYWVLTFVPGPVINHIDRIE